MCPGDCTLTRFNYVLSTAPRSHIDTILHSTSLSKKNYLLYNLTQNIKMLDDICISHAEKEQRIKELKQLNHSITYASSTIHFFWQHENMLSYKRDQVYDLWDMIGMYVCQHCLLTLSNSSLIQNVSKFWWNDGLCNWHVNNGSL